MTASAAGGRSMCAGPSNLDCSREPQTLLEFVINDSGKVSDHASVLMNGMENSILMSGFPRIACGTLT